MKLCRGSLLAEALIGFILFSFILALYVPAYYQLIEQQQLLFNQTDQWQIFYQLCLIHQQKIDTMPIIQRYNTEHFITIADFQITESEATILFSDGSEHYVAITEIF